MTGASQANGLSHSYAPDEESNLQAVGHSGSDTTDSGGAGNGIADWWENYYFGTRGIDPLATPQNDGVTNLMKYALGLDPTTNSSGSLVTLSFQTYTDGKSYPYLTFIRSQDGASLLTVEQSSDSMATWQSGSAVFATISVTDLGDGTEQVIVRSLTPQPAAASLFFRLKVNGGTAPLTAYYAVPGTTQVPAVPWWTLVCLGLSLPFLAVRHLSKKTLSMLMTAGLLFLSVFNSAHAHEILGPGWKNVYAPNPVSVGPDEAVSSTSAQESSLALVQGEVQPLSLVNTSVTATSVTPELQALATALENDPLKIFNYVRNKIDFQPYYGSHKGAHLTYVDGAGNDMDQASLLISLLNQAGVSTTSYVYGKYSLRDQSADGKNLSNWLGIAPNLTAVVLANGGIPVYGGTNYGTYTVWPFDHVWVRATIGGTSYDLDPSYKIYQASAVINFVTASGYDRNVLKTDAGGVDNANYTQNINRTAIENRLSLYTTTLRNYLKTNFPNSEGDTLYGLHRILEQTATTLAQAAPPTAFSPTVTTTFASIPSQYLATLRVQVGSQIDATFNVDALQDNRLSLVFTPGSVPNKAQLWLGDTLITQESTSGSADVSVTLTATHPYNAVSQTLPYSYRRTGSYDLAYSFYANSNSKRRIAASARRLQNYLASNLTDTSREVLTETLHSLSMKWVRQVNAQDDLAGKLTGGYGFKHHIIGRSGQETNSGKTSYYVDMPGDVSSFVQAASYDYQTFNGAALIGSAMEHGVLEQNGSSGSVSTVKYLALATDGGQKIYKATSANYGSAVSPNLTTYSAAQKNTFTTLVNNGSTLLIHENSQTTLNQFKGFGYAEFSYSGGVMQISGGLAGGQNSKDEAASGTVQSQLTQQQTDYILDPAYVTGTKSEEPVDLLTGAYTLEKTDLLLGQLNSPRGLNFTRSYDSLRNFQSNALGNGWRHSCEGKANLSSELDMVFGLNQPADAAQTIVGLLATLDFAENFSTPKSPKEMVIGALAANWTVNRIKNNAANIQLGEQRLTYVSQPDGTWTPPPGGTTTLTGASGSFVLSPRFGGSVVFNAQNKVIQWKDVDNNTQTYVYDVNGRLSTVTDSQGRVLTFSYVSTTSPLIANVTDGTGRSTIFTYTGNNLTGIQDVEGFNTTLVYDARNRLTDWKDHFGGFLVRNTYDAFDRVSQQLSQNISTHLWQFNYAPRMTTEVNPLLGKTTYLFDFKNRGAGSIDPLGNTTSITYDAQNHVIQTQDGSGRKITNVYDGNQNLTKSTDNDNKDTLYTYDGSLRLWKITDATNRTTELGYDGENHLTSSKDPGGRITAMTYRTDGRLNQITQPDTKTTLFTAYDQWANPTAITRADGSTSSAIFNARGDLTSSTDGRAKTTTYTYDKRRLLTGRTDPLLKTSNWTYDSNGRPATATDRNTKITTTVFDNFGKLQSLAAPDTGTVTYGYNLCDWPTTVTDAFNHTTTTGYDAAKRPTSLTDPLTIAISQNAYDGAGRVLQSKNGLNLTTQLFYDTAGRLSYTLDPLNHRTDHTYDFAGRELTLKNRRSQTFSYGYASDGLASTFTYPSARQSAITARDQAGRPATLQEPSNQTTTLTYDGLGRIKTQSDNVGAITNTYDGEGNPTSIAETISGTTKNIVRTYDDLGRVLSCTDASGNVVAYTYDNEGNLKTLTYPGSKTITYTYDGSNRMKSVTDWAGRVTTYTYDTVGRLTQMDRPNGTRQRITYDNANRPTATYEEKGVLSLWQANYGFDNAYRLTSFTPTPIGKTLAPPKATMTYDVDNRLATYNGQSVLSDTDGNLLSVPVNGSLLGAATYDARNRLLSAGGITYTYDAENRRITSTIASQTTNYLWSRGKLDRLLVKTNPDGSITRYVHGLGLLYEENTSVSNVVSTQTYHYNWQGSTIALSDSTGTVSARLSYSPYGERTIESGATLIANSPFCYNGQWGVMTESNGLLCMQARLYSPVFRRFLSEDPSGFSGGINLYAYSGGDPINYLDPFGLGPLSFWQDDPTGGLNSIIMKPFEYLGDFLKFIDGNTGGIDNPRPSAILALFIPELRIEAEVEQQVLYHYTTEEGLAGILNSGELKPSLSSINPSDARYGNGQYLSDIIPGSKTLAQLSREFLGQPFQGQKFTHFLEIDVTGLKAIEGRPGVFVIQGEVSLDLSGRIISSGAH